ncbi:MAG: hypothetical protein NTU98_10565 [Bacteroidetes bacterium]|nr:hypothetical protein [Bacteroidota bacterium]
METEAIKFQITKLKEIGFSYIEPTDPGQTQKIDQLEVGINVNYRWNLEQDIFGVHLDIAYIKEILEHQKTELLKFSSYTEFKVLNLQKIFKVNNPNDFIMDETLETTFVSIAISSTRGMLASRTAGTFFSQFIFPLVSPGDLILSKKIKAGKLTESQEQKPTKTKNKKLKKG